MRDAGYLYDASSAAYHRSPRPKDLNLARVSNTFPSSLLRLPQALSLPVLRSAAALLPLVVLDYHPWELVRMPAMRPDMSFATGSTAAQRLGSVFANLKSLGFEFVTMREAALGARQQ